MKNGLVDLEELKKHVDSDTAALMLTNPNTLGLFEKEIAEIAEVVHEAGGLLYYDGANANAILGKTTPGAMGFDIVHLNLHKTFTGPHGGGGPGAGPVGVKEILIPYLPVPRVEKDGDKFVLNSNYPLSIGRVKGYYGNFGILVRAYAYIRTMGPMLDYVKFLKVLFFMQITFVKNWSHILILHIHKFVSMNLSYLVQDRRNLVFVHLIWQNVC